MTLVSGNIKVYADVRGGSLDRGRQTTVGLSKTAIFSSFARYFFSSEALELRPKYCRLLFSPSTPISTDSIIVNLAFNGRYFLSIRVQNLLIYLHGQRHYICGETNRCINNVFSLRLLTLQRN